MNQPVHRLPGAGRRQQGVVLVVSLLMLMVLTLIGLAATRSTTLEERMTANQTDFAVAFQAAEAALRDGEGQLSSASQPNYSGNASGAYDATTMDASTIDWHIIDWTDTNKIKKYGGGITPAPPTGHEPSYFIVKTSFVTPTQGSQSTDVAATSDYTFYIYAHGYGLSNAEVVLQSTFQE